MGLLQHMRAHRRAKAAEQAGKGRTRRRASDRTEARLRSAREKWAEVADRRRNRGGRRGPGPRGGRRGAKVRAEARRVVRREEGKRASEDREASREKGDRALPGLMWAAGQWCRMQRAGQAARADVVWLGGEAAAGLADLRVGEALQAGAAEWLVVRGWAGMILAAGGIGSLAWRIGGRAYGDGQAKGGETGTTGRGGTGGTPKAAS